VTNTETKLVTTNDEGNNGEVAEAEAEAKAISARRPKRLSPKQRLALFNKFYENKGERDKNRAEQLNKSELKAARDEALNRKRMEAEAKAKVELVAEADKNSENSNSSSNTGIGSSNNSNNSRLGGKIKNRMGPGDEHEIERIKKDV